MQDSQMDLSAISYDEALARVESIVTSLEQSEVISMELYRQKANEAKALIAHCRKQIEALEENLRA